MFGGGVFETLDSVNVDDEGFAPPTEKTSGSAISATDEDSSDVPITGPGAFDGDILDEGVSEPSLRVTLRSRSSPRIRVSVARCSKRRMLRRPVEMT